MSILCVISYTQIHSMRTVTIQWRFKMSHLSLLKYLINLLYYNILILLNISKCHFKT